MEIISKTKIDYTLLKNSKLVFPKNMRSKQIYHYTSIGGLQGILENKTLRFTNIKYMNDKDEIIAGLDCFAKSLNASEEDREKYLSPFTNESKQIFVCCFSLEEDSLPMWNYYTKEINSQGYNIEFDDKKLVESILRNNPHLEGCDFAFGNVDYSKDNESTYSMTLTDEMMLSMKLVGLKLSLVAAKGLLLSGHKSDINEEEIKKLEEEIRSVEKKLKRNNLPIYFYNGEKCVFEKLLSAGYLFFIKRHHFIQEKEFRIVVTVPNELLHKLAEQKVYKFRVSNGILVPYIELKFSEDVVKSVSISPTINSDLVESSIQDFMRYCRYDIEDFSKFIKHSRIPVRF